MVVRMLFVHPSSLGSFGASNVTWVVPILTYSSQDEFPRRLAMKTTHSRNSETPH